MRNVVGRTGKSRASITTIYSSINIKADRGRLLYCSNKHTRTTFSTINTRFSPHALKIRD
jgi:hypothetical protein